MDTIKNVVIKTWRNPTAIPGFGGSLNFLPWFIWNDEYVLAPGANVFNRKVSYWISRKGCTRAFYAFSISSIHELPHTQNLPMLACEEVSEDGKRTLASYMAMMDFLCPKEVAEA